MNEMPEEDIQRKNAESFIHSDVYNNKVCELLNNNKIFHMMICNDIVRRINRIYTHNNSYINMRNEYSVGKIHDHLGQLEDSLVAEEIVYHIRKAIDEMIYLLWIDKVGVLNIDNKQNNPIDSIGKYLNQKIKIIDDFDDFLSFLNEINILSNSYKHSINTFSHIESDLSCNEKAPFFKSYAIRDKDFDVAISQDDLINMLKIIFNKFLSII